MPNRRSVLRSLLLLPLLAVTGCETTGGRMQGIQNARIGSTSGREGLAASIASEAPGDYFIGRRYYKQDYKFWGYVRRPGQPWSTAQMVVLNEQTKLAPDREQGRFGSDNGYEYKLYGSISPEKVYEPASNSTYVEFNLLGYEVRSVNPPSIFRTPGALDPTRRIIARPY